MLSDREKWNQRYADETDHLPEPDPFLVRNSNLLESGRALDLACGRGANAIYLANSGYTVDAIDISDKAISRLRTYAIQRGLGIQGIVADLDYFTLAKDNYNLIVVFYFFSESLFAPIQQALKAGGLLFYATYNTRHTSIQPGFNPDYLVEPQALARYLVDLEILVNEPEAGEDRNISRLIGRKR